MFKEMSQLAGLLKQAQSLPDRMREMQRQLAEVRCTGRSPQGDVAIEVTGQGTAVDCRIDPQLLQPDRASELSARIVYAINDAQEQLRQLALKHTSELTGGTGLGELLSGLGAKQSLAE